MALGLKGTKTVLDRLNLTLPEHILHVAGSNGKGTVCALMATALCLDGIDNVLFSSPHVVRLEERVRRNGVPISSEAFDKAVEMVRKAALGAEDDSSIDLTFFEVTYLVAMVCSQGCQVLILETGLGGRLDATRCGPATACLVTSVTREHTDILGEDLATIAREKAAIARPGRQLLVRDPSDSNVLKAMAYEARHAGNTDLDEISLASPFQIVSIGDGATVRDEAHALAHALFQTIGFSETSLDQAQKELRWLARMQHLTPQQTSSHAYLLDAAHNPSGLRRILPELERALLQHSPHLDSCPVWSLLLGTSPQDNLDDFIAPLLELCSRFPPRNIVLTQPEGGRYPAVLVDELAELSWRRGDVESHASPREAVNALAKKDAETVGLVVSLGSLYLQGNLLSHFGWSSDEHLSLHAKN